MVECKAFIPECYGIPNKSNMWDEVCSLGESGIGKFTSSPYRESLSPTNEAFGLNTIRAYLQTMEI